MLFYDNDVYKYELYIALKPNIEGFDEEIRLHYYDEKNPDQVMTLYRGNNRAVVDFLNDDNFFSFFPLDEPTDAQNVRYSKHIPTDAEREVLNRFLDEVIISKDSLDRFWFCKDVSCTYKSETRIISSLNDDEEKPFISFVYSFERAYDLFLFECMEMLRTHQKLGMCSHCGRYFYPKNLRAKYCSQKCHSDANKIKSPAAQMYQKSYFAKHKYAIRHADNPQVQQDYHTWLIDANSAKVKFERGEISESEYTAILCRDIKYKDYV